MAQGKAVRLFNNFEAAAEVLGVLRDWAGKWTNEELLTRTTVAAAEGAVKWFNLEAVTRAKSGQFRHMFEHGTKGINDGSRSGSVNPMKPDGQLWVTRINQQGKGVGVIGWDYRPAAMSNPPVTTANSAVDPEKLKHLSNKQYIFRNRAAVIEQGQSVSVRSSSGKLFVPLGRPSKPWVKPVGEYKSGYFMIPAANNNPISEQSIGTFTQFWAEWWAGRGQEEMLKTTNRVINDHIRWYNNQALARAKKSKKKSAEKVRIVKARQDAMHKISAAGEKEFKRLLREEKNK